MIVQDGTVQRNDLKLRIVNPGLKTEIYKMNSYEYIIYCMNYKGDFKELYNNFNKYIRQVGTNVILDNKKPVKYLNKINKIPLSNVVNEFNASCITMNDLNDFIQSKFFDVDILNICTPKVGIDFEILIEVSNKTKKSRIDAMKKYLSTIDLGTDKIEVKSIMDNNKKSEDNKVNKSSFDVMNLSINKELPFTVDEANFWIENAEKIYKGKFTRSELPFYRENTSKCFLDCSIFENINLRNVLLLYDTVFIALPIEEHLFEFFEQQDITAKELLELIEMGKLVILLPNLENRYDKKLVLEAYNLNPNSIIGRRGINSLLAAYLNETKNQYENRLPKIYDIASDIYMEGKMKNNLELINLARLLAWPITSAADSFSYLNRNGPLSVSNFGVNNIVNNYIFKDDNEDKIKFEFLINATSIHISSALKATYFPFNEYKNNQLKYSDRVISNILGNFLRFYWYDATNIQNIKNIQSQNKSNFLNLFASKKNISISKVAMLADDYNTPCKFKEILFNLDKMEEKQRKIKIKEYNDILFDINQTRTSESHKIFKFMLGGADFLPLSYPVSIVLSSLGLISEKIISTDEMKKKMKIKSIEKCIEQNGPYINKQNPEDIYILDKISSVATLK